MGTGPWTETRPPRPSIAPSDYTSTGPVVGSILGPIAEDAVSALGRGAPRHVGQIEAAIMDAASEGDTSMLPPGADWDSLLAKALAEGVAYLKERMGDDLGAWEWGKSAPHPASAYAVGVLPRSGPAPRPAVGPHGRRRRYPPLGKLPSHRALRRHRNIGFPLRPSISATGTTLPGYHHWAPRAIPAVPTYSDQTPIWADIQLVPMLYDWGRIEKGKRQGLGSGV